MDANKDVDSFLVVRFGVQNIRAGSELAAFIDRFCTLLSIAAFKFSTTPLSLSSYTTNGTGFNIDTSKVCIFKLSFGLTLLLLCCELTYMSEMISLFSKSARCLISSFIS